MKVKFIDYKKDYLRFKTEYDKAWEDVNMRGDLILRKDIDEFEQRLAEYVGTKYAVALSSGTDAIFLSLKALGIGEGDKVALPSRTFKATCGAVVQAGAEPIILDLGETSQHGTQIVVHIAGKLSDIPVGDDKIIIEDACQALGALKNPTSHVQCWSFYPAKLLGCKGDAGAITTNSLHIYEYIKGYRNHFKTNNEELGGNYRMDNLQAALLNVKIQHVDEIIERREQIAYQYNIHLGNILSIPMPSKERVYQDYIIRIDKRDELYEFLKKEGIETIKNEYPFSPNYPKPPKTAEHEATTLRIPCNENLTDEEVNYVIKKIKQFFL